MKPAFSSLIFTLKSIVIYGVIYEIYMGKYNYSRGHKKTSTEGHMIYWEWLLGIIHAYYIIPADDTLVKCWVPMA